jgi:hypothetical protein
VTYWPFVSLAAFAPGICVVSFAGRFVIFVLFFLACVVELELMLPLLAADTAASLACPPPPLPAAIATPEPTEPTSKAEIHTVCLIFISCPSCRLRF